MNSLLNTKVLRWVGIAFYFLSTSYFFYIGRFETIYGAGVALMLIVQAFGLVLFGLGTLLSGFQWKKSLYAAMAITTVIQIVFITIHRVERYKPTYTIHLPEHYSGEVHLFITPEERVDVFVNENGLGYMGSRGKANWKIKRGNHQMPEVFKSGRSSQITHYNSDSTMMTTYHMSCYIVDDTLDYSQFSDRYYITPCLTTEAFFEIVKKYQVDLDRLRKIVYTRESALHDWVFDEARSNP